MKVLSSVAASNLENCVQIQDANMKQEDANYLTSKLFIAETQSRVLPSESLLVEEITPQYLMDVLSYLPTYPEQKLRTIFKTINDEKADSRANT